MNSNQYLRPDELPITDMKKSPLVLLAQTCSNIGADILGNGKLRVGSDSSKRKSSPRNDSGHKSQSRSDSEKTQAPSTDTNRSSVNSLSAGDEIVAGNQLSGHNHSHNRTSTPFSPNERIIIAEHNHRLSGHGGSSPTGGANSEQIIQSAPKSASIFKPYETSNSKCDNSDTAASTPTLTNGNDQRSGSNSNRKSADSAVGSPKPKQGSATNQIRSSVAGYPSTTASNSPHSQSTKGSAESMAATSRASLLELEAVKAAYATSQGFANYPNSMAEHELLMRSFAYHQQQVAGMAGRKFCSDPFCRGCQMAMAGLPSVIPCTSAMASLANGAAHQAAALNPFANSAASLLSISSRYQHPGPPASVPGGARGPHTCSWTAPGVGYCGKTFSTSDELLQHLKSHSSAGHYNPASVLHGLRLGYGQLDPLPVVPPGVGLRHPPVAAANRFHPYGAKFVPPAAGINPLLNHAILAQMNQQAAAPLGLTGHGYPPISGAGSYRSAYADRIGPIIPP